MQHQLMFLGYSRQMLNWKDLKNQFSQNLWNSVQIEKIHQQFTVKTNKPFVRYSNMDSCTNRQTTRMTNMDTIRKVGPNENQHNNFICFCAFLSTISATLSQYIFGIHFNLPQSSETLPHSRAFTKLPQISKFLSRNKTISRYFIFLSISLNNLCIFYHLSEVQIS